jgi:hypothetical protein
MANTTSDAQQHMTLENPALRAPRAAAIAGIVFSVLLITIVLLIQLSVPREPLESGNWLAGNAGAVGLALNLVPFAGIAFLWFIGVVRDRIGPLEDRLFATVFLGSGLLFLAMLFASAAQAGTLIRLYNSSTTALAGSDIYTYGRATTYEIMNIYAVKMAGVFMISTSTVSLRTGILPRWMTFLGIALALILLFSIGTIEGVLIVFPLWVLVISVYMLIMNLRKSDATRPAGLAATEPASADKNAF